MLINYQLWVEDTKREFQAKAEGEGLAPKKSVKNSIFFNYILPVSLDIGGTFSVPESLVFWYSESYCEMWNKIEKDFFKSKSMEAYFYEQ